MIRPIPPCLIYFAGALLLPFLKGKAKKIFLLVLPLVAFIDLLRLPFGTSFALPFLDYELVFLQVDKLSLVFGYVFVIISFAGLLYSLHVEDDLQQVSALFYAGSVIVNTVADVLITASLSVPVTSAFAAAIMSAASSSPDTCTIPSNNASAVAIK